jgi:hypothetical protein
MAWFSALDASYKFELGISIGFNAPPDLETAHLFVAVEPASIALDYVCLHAVDSQVAGLIALETNLLGACERIVSVLSAQNAGCSLGLIHTLPRPMPSLTAVFATKQRVFFQEITRLVVLLHNLVKCIISF